MNTKSIVRCFSHDCAITLNFHFILQFFFLYLLLQACFLHHINVDDPKDGTTVLENTVAISDPEARLVFATLIAYDKENEQSGYLLNRAGYEDDDDPVWYMYYCYAPTGFLLLKEFTEKKKMNLAISAILP